VFKASKARAFFEQIINTARANNLEKVLVDTRSFSGELSVMERYDIGTLLSGLRPLRIRLVFVVHPSVVLPDHFGENVAVNRGVNMWVTTDLTQALEWLYGIRANQAIGGDTK
jgi:hypothetical protein